MLLRKIFITIFSILILNKAYAVPQWTPGSFYVDLSAGESFSQSAQIKVFTGPNNWDATPNGYNNDLGNSPVFGAGVGYVINPLWRVELTVDHRNSFHYKKFQTSTGQFGNKTRYFDFKNTTVMANLFMDGSGLPYDLAYHSANFTLDPFITVGAGAAFNTVNNFYTIPVSTGTKVSIMGSYTQVSFAYQLGAGFNLLTTKPLSFSIGYRYLDAGNFRTDNYLRDLNVITVPWRGKLRTQEVYATLRYLIS